MLQKPSLTNFKKPTTQTTEKLKTAINSKIKTDTAKKHPLFLVAGILGFTFVIALLFFLKTTMLPGSGNQDVTKPKNLILKSQMEIIDEASEALKRNDYPTFSQIIGTDNNTASDVKDVNMPDSKGIPLIVMAAANRNMDAVQLLIFRGADVNAPNVYTGDTALMLAARNGDVEMTLVLVRTGADTNAKNKYNQTPLLFAIDSGKRDIANVLISSGATEGSNNDNLIFYVNKKNYLGVESMVRTGASPNAKSPKGFPAITAAAALGDLQILNLLVLYKANIEATDPDGSTALITAVKYRHEDIANFLIDKGADINAKNKFDETPLFWAAYNGLAPITDVLLNAKADATVKNRDGYTPYKVAEIQKKEDVITVYKKYRLGVDGKELPPPAPQKKKKK